MSYVPVTREEFEKAYVDYHVNNGYAYQPWDIEDEWKRYQSGRSWFAIKLHNIVY